MATLAKLRAYFSPSQSTKEERKLVQKIDFFILTFCCLSYFCNYASLPLPSYTAGPLTKCPARPLQPYQCLRLGNADGPQLQGEPAHSDQHHLHLRLHHWSDTLQPRPLLHPAAGVFPLHDGGLGCFDHGYGICAKARAYHGHPLLSSHCRIHHLRGHPLHPRVLVHRQRTGQAQRHIHSIWPRRDHVRRFHPDRHPEVPPPQRRPYRLALALHHRWPHHTTRRPLRLPPLPQHTQHDQRPLPLLQRARSRHLPRPRSSRTRAALPRLRQARPHLLLLLRLRHSVDHRRRDRVILNQHSARALPQSAPNQHLHRFPAQCKRAHLLHIPTRLRRRNETN
ncbi:hypothetical protein MPH_10784 [Macrophomina phaseolina MS6]|uniref:Uncharacterized protein n=1 Tax=Macrophomina phaseolina (strain MS6) TaxID=1126212 RepID=K2RC05_MACPH|nr:hypothetical protein MPH_10784 [Macrophomina phaseolina MS6]